MVSRVGELLWLKDAAARTFAHGRAELARGLAGKARWLNELVDGQSAVAGEPPVTPPNPQGLVGIDCSGPPWGSAWRHPVAWVGGRGTDTTDWQAPAKHTPLIHTAGRQPVGISRWHIRNRCHEVLPAGYTAPYAALQVKLRARVRSATATLTVRGRVDDGDLVTLGTASLTTTMTAFTLSTAKLPLPGGGQAAHRIYIEVSTSAGTAEVEALSINVAEKRNA